MRVDALKSNTKLAIALSFSALTGCASDGGLGEAAVWGAMLLPMPTGMDPGVATAAVGLATSAYVFSSVATSDSPTVAPATSTIAAPTGQPPLDLQKLVTRETPDRYRPKSCDYIEMALSELPMYRASPEPILQQVAVARQAAASKVWLEKDCKPSELPGGKIGINMDTIDPQRAAALGQPTSGVVVLATVPGSGAQQGGILPQDAIVAVDNTPVADSIAFRVAIAKAAIGSPVQLKVWRGGAYRMMPVVVGAAGTQVSVTPSVVPDGALYCTAGLSTQHTYGATISPVKLITGAATSMQPSIRSYIAKVKQEQPGVWGDFKIDPAMCSAGAAVCMAEAEGPTGKKQNAFEFCRATQALADAELAQMRQGDPKAVLVDWP